MRHGMEWADEAGQPKPAGSSSTMIFAPAMIPMGMIGDEDFEDLEDEDLEEIAYEFGEMVDETDPSMTVLHFCSSACLSEWASTASAVET